MSETPSKARSKRWRRLRWIAALGLLAIVVGLAALPWLIGTPIVLRTVLAQVNRIYAPTVIELDGVSASWTGPVRLRGLVLRDPNGKAVVTSPTGTLDRSLWQLLTIRPDYGTLTLHGAVVDIERRADGSIDLAEALDPLLAGDDEPDDGPETQFTLVIEAGTLVVASPELAAPVTAERLDMTLHCVPNPLTWEIALANPGDQAMTIVGSYDSEVPSATEILVDIEGTDWPFSVAQAGVTADFIFGGKVEVRSTAEALELAGRAILTEVALGGATLKGDHPRFDRITAAWDVDLGDALEIRQLSLDSTIAKVGLAPEQPVGTSHWVGRVDLAALAAQLPNTLVLREGLILEQGVADLDAIVHDANAEGGRPLAITARIADLAARDGGRLVSLGEPLTLAARVVTRPGAAPMVEGVRVDSSFLKAEGNGDLDGGVKLAGTVDLNALDRQLREWVDLGAVTLAGSGRFGGDYRQVKESSSFDARLAIEFSNLNLVGLGSSPIARDAARLDLVLQGPSTPSGLPKGWDRVHLEGRSEGLEAIVDTVPDGEAYGISGHLIIPEAATDDREVAPPPTRVVFRTTYHPDEDWIDLSAFDVDHHYGGIRAKGRIDALTTGRVADLSGTTEPNWDEISAMVAAATEPAARVSGNARDFRIAGPLAGGSTTEILSNLDAEVGIDLTDAVVFGMDVGPVPLVVRCTRGDLQVAPIDTTLNGGRVVLLPDLVVGDDDSIVLTLEQGSGIDRVQITDEVSKRVLAYIAPVLREATQVQGQLSARIDRALIPIVGPEPAQGGPSTDLAAKVAFQQVHYGPGPLMQKILGMTGIGAGQVPALTIDQVVEVAVANGRVTQSGLEIVAAEGVAIQLEGSVGLDQTLAMRAGVPLSDRLLGGQEVVENVLGGTRVGLPIGGTLSDPQLDREAFRVGLRDQGRQLLGRGAAVGAGRLLQMLDEDGQASGTGAGNAGGGIAPPAEEVIRGVGRGLLNDVLNRRRGPAPAPVSPVPTPVPNAP